MKLRPLMRILAKHETVYISESVQEESNGDYFTDLIALEEDSEEEQQTATRKAAEEHA